MFVDEFYFHHKRGLPKWERWGHPLDTMTVLLVFASYLFLDPFAETPIWLFAAMIFSSLFITKDEWVHHDKCPAMEQWLHSLLFVLHPALMIVSYLLWKKEGATLIFQAQPIILTLFLCYQIFYWNFYVKKIN